MSGLLVALELPDGVVEDSFVDLEPACRLANVCVLSGDRQFVGELQSHRDEAAHYLVRLDASISIRK
jgi:hypothetical protein